MSVNYYVNDFDYGGLGVSRKKQHWKSQVSKKHPYNKTIISIDFSLENCSVFLIKIGCSRIHLGRNLEGRIEFDSCEH